MKIGAFYKESSHFLILVLMIEIAISISVVAFLMYIVSHRPMSLFYAVQENGNSIALTSYQEPNLLPDTIIRWASKAAATAYNFDFVHYKEQLAEVRPYFTLAGWQDYTAALQGPVTSVIKNQLFVNGVVTGPPVISNQGNYPERGYVWRVQIPFLITYQSANKTSQQNYLRFDK